jgi:excinuclease ABC subunit C
LRFIKNDIETSIEEVHEPMRKNPLKFKKNDPVLLFLQKMRDEAHRFAITYSRHLSLNKRKLSPLLEIAGIGVARAKKLLTEIPDIYTRADLTAEMIRDTCKLPVSVAEAVLMVVKKSDIK